MTEYVVNVPDEEAEYFIARFWLEGTTLMGYHLSDEIVRCRDCKYVPFFDGFGDGWCSQNCHGVKALDYCVWGKRKEGGE